jgi:hypothetical protein
MGEPLPQPEMEMSHHSAAGRSRVLRTPIGQCTVIPLTEPHGFSPKGTQIEKKRSSTGGLYLQGIYHLLHSILPYQAV